MEQGGAMQLKRKKIAIVGGGFGGLFTALGLDGTGETTLITQDDRFTFTPMLYEYLSGEVEAWHIAPYYKDLVDGKARVMRGEVTDIDFDKREIYVSNRSNVFDYDVLVLAAGGTTNYY